MNCVIPGGNLKVINKTLLALHKISDELYIECKPECLTFVAMNMNRTAYATYNFHSVFFLSYTADESGSQNSNENRNITCKLHMKSILNVFKQKMDRKIEVCTVELDRDATIIVLKLKYKHDITVVHNLKLIDFDYLSFNYDSDSMKNNLTVNGLVYAQILSNFQFNDSNLTLEVNSNKTVFRNYDTGTQAAYKGMRSQVALNGNEFMVYDVGEETSIVMSLKPFRCGIHFAEQFSLNASLHFNSGGWPLILRMKSTTFEADFVLSTVNPDGSTQTTSSAPPMLIIPNKNNVTVQDQQAMEDENWDEEIIAPRRSDNTNFENVLRNLNQNKVSPVLKRAKVFSRCFEATFHQSKIDFGEVLAPNSDSDE